MTFGNRSAMERGPDGNLYVRAPAKLNLFLHITGRRADGYHLLESLFVFTRRGDLLRMQLSDSFSFSMTGPFSAQLKQFDAAENLVVKAAKAIAAHVDKDCNVSIELEKNLPLASGLGGGSADAAATLIGLDTLWDLNLPDSELLALALALGADVPACLYSRSLIARGVGEQIKPLSLPWEAGAVIVNPNKGVSTPAVFARYKEYRQQRGMPPFDIAINDVRSVVADTRALSLLTSNSLEDPARDICPEIIEVERYLRHNSQADFVRMTGSGASVAALYPSREAAIVVARRIREHMPHWWVMADEIC